MMLQKFKIIFLLLFCTLGIAVMSSGASSLVQGYFSTTWPFTDGIVTKVYSTQGSNGRAPCHSVSYAYKIKNVSYTGNRIIFGHICFGSDVAPYSKGQFTRVYFKPDAPENSVLRYGVLRNYCFFIIVGLAFLIFGAGSIWYEKHLTHHSSGTG